MRPTQLLPILRLSLECWHLLYQSARNAAPYQPLLPLIFVFALPGLACNDVHYIQFGIFAPAHGEVW